MPRVHTQDSHSLRAGRAVVCATDVVIVHRYRMSYRAACLTWVRWASSIETHTYGLRRLESQSAEFRRVPANDFSALLTATAAPASVFAPVIAVVFQPCVAALLPVAARSLAVARFLFALRFLRRNDLNWEWT